MIYIIMRGYYSDWEILGYFTDREDAEKYVVSDGKDDIFIEEAECFDGTVDLSYVVVRYKKPIIFRRKGGSWACEDNGEPELYQAGFPKSNYIETIYLGEWIRVWVNTTKNDLPLQMKVAQDIFYSFLNFCEGEPDDESIYEFNKVLSKEEDDRIEAEKQEKIREEELAELARLKAKYGE